MGVFKTPRIDIDGIPLDAPNVQWTMVSGSKTNNMRLVVGSGTAKALMRLSNPVTLSFEVDVATEVDGSSQRRTTLPGEGVAANMKVERITRRVQNLYILEIAAANNPWFYEVRIGDQRHFWSERVFSREFNVHRGTNEVRRIVFGGGRESAANTLEFSGERYSPWTLKNKTSPTFANSRTSTAGSATPWSALNAVRNLLEQECGLKFSTGGGAGTYGFYQGKDIENGYRPEDAVFEMSPLTSGLDQLMNMADVNMYQALDGGIILYNSLDFSQTKTILENFQPMDGSGYPVVQDLSRVRPSKSRLIFPKEYEIKFDYQENPQRLSTVPRDQVDFTLWNVLQLPDDITVKISSNETKKYLRGSWMPIEIAVNFWDDLPGPHKDRGIKLSMENIRKHWFSSKLAFIYTQKVGQQEADPVWVKRISQIKTHYRQTFKIAGWWMDRIRSWKPDRAAVLDPLTGERQPSPVYMNYCEIPSFRFVQMKGGSRSKQSAAYNVTGFASNVDNVDPSPFSISVVSQDIGIFKIRYETDTQDLIQSIVPSEVNKIPPLSVGSNAADLLWNGASLKESHNMSVILSVVLAEPNDEARHEVVNFDLSPGVKGKVQDVPIRRDTARYRWTNNTRAIFQNDQVKIQNAELVNRQIIEAIAKAEAEQLKEKWQDLTIGVFSQPGHKTEWVPSGSMRSVTIKYTPSRGLETEFNMSERPQRFDIFTLLPQSVRSVLYKQIATK